MFQTKDQFLFEMIRGAIHLSKKDYSFLHNISVKIKDSKFITENQSTLFNKLLKKYKRQITKFGYDSEIIEKLPWNISVLESKPEFLQARVCIENEMITLRTPFNRKFLNDFRDKNLNCFEWDKNTKIYVAPFSTYNLKLAISTARKHFSDIYLCDNIQSLLKDLEKFAGVRYWKPTLVKNNNNFLIVSTNEHLDKQLETIRLNDDPKTLFRLSLLGVHIDNSITNNDPLLEFAGNYQVTMDLDYVTELCRYLKEIDVEQVFTSRDVIYNKQVNNEIKLLFLEKGIAVTPIGNKNTTKGVLLKGKSSLVETYLRFSKIITLTNSRPIKIR